MVYNNDSRTLCKVITVGNSLGVVFPRPACRLLRIDRTTKLDMSYGDSRILIRPIERADRVGQPDREAFTKLLDILVKAGMSERDFDRLSHDGTSWRTFVNDISIGGHLDLVTVARLKECLGRKRDLERTRQAMDWEDVVDAVLVAVPSIPIG